MLNPNPGMEEEEQQLDLPFNRDLKIDSPNVALSKFIKCTTSWYKLCIKFNLNSEILEIGNTLWNKRLGSCDVSVTPA